MAGDTRRIRSEHQAEQAGSRISHHFPRTRKAGDYHWESSTQPAISMNRTVLPLLILAAFLPWSVRADLDCIVPTREEGFERGRAGAEALRRAAHAAAAISQKNAVFMAGNKPVRVRTSIAYYGTDWLAASVITVAYNKKAWLPGSCKLSPFADRGGGLADGRIALYINDPESLLGGRLGDAQLNASMAPKRMGNLAGFPIWGAGGDETNPRVLLTAAGYEPWVPVTTDEHLAWQSRVLDRAEADWNASRKSSANDLSDSKIEEMVQSMKKSDAAGAEKMRTQLLKSQANLRAESERQTALLERRRRALEAYRASFTPAQLSAPTTLSHRIHAEAISRVDDPEGRPLVRMDPQYIGRRADRVHMIVVSIAPQPKTDPEYLWQNASYDALDYGALAALLSR